MAYATPQEIVDRYGENVLPTLADRDGDGPVDEAPAERALSDASDEIDAYLARKYELPLESPPPKLLTRLCIDIALYRLAAEAASGTEEQRQRYEDGVRLLKSMARGGVSLGRPGPARTPAPGASFQAAERVFSRQSLRGF